MFKIKVVALKETCILYEFHVKLRLYYIDVNRNIIRLTPFSVHLLIPYIIEILSVVWNLRFSRR